MPDNLQTKTTKLINYAKSQLSSKGITSTATTLRGALDDIANISAGGTQAILNAPKVVLSGSVLYLTNPTTNGDFAQGFKIYNGTTLLSTQLIDVTTFDLSTVLTTNGTYTITTKCYGTNMNDSMTTSINYIVGGTATTGYLAFESTDNLEFTLKTANTTANWNGTLEYSTDTKNWNTWDGDILYSDDEKLYLRGINNNVITGDNDDFGFKFGGSSTRIQCNGNIENLLDYTTVANGQHPTMADYCFAYLFRWCTTLTTPPTLPATTLANSCYGSMFKYCTSLTTPPQLPATTLATSCYSDMFDGCSSLTTAPQLPAITLANSCYGSMFKYCTSLTTPPQLPATTLATSCYSGMFWYSALNTLPKLPATTLAERCYYLMFAHSSIKISSKYTEEYKYSWRIPTNGTGTDAQQWYIWMFDNTDGTLTGSPSINTTYYTTNQPV